MEGELGTVRRGKLADLVVLDANPLNDIGNTSRIHAVLVRGKLLTPQDRQRILAEIAAAAKEETTPAATRIGGCCG